MVDDVRRGKWTQAIEVAITDEQVKRKLLRLLQARGDPRKKDQAILKSDIEAYFAAIEHQDELFDIALTIIKSEFASKGFTANTPQEIITRATSVNGQRVMAKNYLDDVQRLIAFKKEEVGSDPTKLQRIESESLATLLLFPARLNNVFIQSLANLFILLKKDRSILEQIQDPSILDIAVAQYSANIHGNAYLQTANPLRDGFYMNQGINDFKKILDDGFLKKFLAKIIATTPAVPLQRNSDWENITALVFKWYVDKTSWEEDHVPGLLNLFKEKSTVDDSITAAQLETIPETKDYFPNRMYYTVPIGSVTLLELMQRMENMTLEYILHLAYTIRKLEKEQA